MREEVVFNGIRLSDYFDVINVDRPNAGVVSTTQAVSGRDGAVLVGSVMGTVTIAVTIMLRETGVEGRRARMREVQALLHTDEPRPIEFGGDEGLYYMVKLDGDAPLVEHVRSGLLTVNFTAFDPVMYGRMRSVTVPSGGVAHIRVDGSHFTYPRIVGDVYGANQTGNLWGIRLDDGDNMRIPMGGTSQKHLEIDCGDRVCMVGTSLVLPTMQSDWLRFEVGTHKLENDVGTGACTVTWYERWR